MPKLESKRDGDEDIGMVKTCANWCGLEETIQLAYFLSYPYYFYYLVQKPHLGIQNLQFPYQLSIKSSYLYHSYPLKAATSR